MRLRAREVINARAACGKLSRGRVLEKHGSPALRIRGIRSKASCGETCSIPTTSLSSGEGGGGKVSRNRAHAHDKSKRMVACTRHAANKRFHANCSIRRCAECCRDAKKARRAGVKCKNVYIENKKCKNERRLSNNTAREKKKLLHCSSFHYLSISFKSYKSERV